MSLFERTTSGFPLSISTGHAFESIFPRRTAAYDPEREIPQKINIGNYGQMWINLDTLFRNIVQAVTSDVLKNVGYKEAVTVLIDEMDTIESLLAVEGQNQATPVFYVCDYPHALSSLPKTVGIRKDNTPKQFHYRDLRNKTMAEMKKLRSDIKFFPGPIRTANSINTLMLTHVPFDLLSWKQFGSLDLLESNTGKLKKKSQWNTKYYPVPSKNMSILPWMRGLLYVFGDKVLIQPAPSKLRIQIMDSAAKRGWTAATTKEKVLLDLSNDLHPFDYSLVANASTVP